MACSSCFVDNRISSDVVDTVEKNMRMAESSLAPSEVRHEAMEHGAAPSEVVQEL